ncbi:hypothetical protein EVG20_g5469 [Dentipellis fragilis]|uniref:Uncharacterized protein n=1 Tax=Dentipellis fragilis TaxID=205917 RepID=A0A4Y9YV59_9AGAM|nr:hypothetical protein EVG20_g5469 [Dentipellis fragilis]
MCGEKYFAIQVSGLWAVSVLYGLYIAVFGGSIYVLVYRRPNTYHLGSSIALFLLTATYMATILAQILGEPVITSSSTIANGNTASPCSAGSSERLHEASTADLLIIIENVVLTSTSLIADGVLMYRCLVLWPHRLGRPIGILLGILLLAEAAIGYAIPYYNAQAYFIVRQETPANEGMLSPKWIEVLNTGNNLSTANTIFGLAVNAIATILIASRIWYMAHQLENMMGRASGVRIESGLLISTTQLVTTCTTLIDSTVLYGQEIFEITQMLVVIAPTLIILRVGMGKGFDSVVETEHQHHASQGLRETQIRSIRFAEHRTTITNGSHLASLGAIVPATELDPEEDAHSADYSSGYSNTLGQAEGTKAEKVEVGLNVA